MKVPSPGPGRRTLLLSSLSLRWLLASPELVKEEADVGVPGTSGGQDPGEARCPHRRDGALGGSPGGAGGDVHAEGTGGPQQARTRNPGALSGLGYPTQGSTHSRSAQRSWGGRNDALTKNPNTIETLGDRRTQGQENMKTKPPSIHSRGTAQHLCPNLMSETVAVRTWTCRCQR